MKDKNTREIIEDAIAGGIIGAALGALLTGKGKTTIIASILGAAIGASIGAQKKLKEIDVPFLYSENGVIYRVFPNGEREFVKNIEQNKVEIPTNFTIE